MDCKLLAIDLDDTLLGDDLVISQETKQAVKKAKAAGVKVVIATGRMYCSALPYAQELGLAEEIITYNGALMKKIAAEEEVFHHPVPLSVTKQIADYIETEDLHLNLYLDDALYVNKSGWGADYYEEVSGEEAVLIEEPLDQFLSQPPTKLLIIERDEEKRERSLQTLKQKFGEQVYVTSSKTYFIEIMNRIVSKGEALQELTDRLEIDREEVIAIGDSYNDLEMLEYAGLGAAVNNADQPIREQADYVTASEHDEGVAEVINKFIL